MGTLELKLRYGLVDSIGPRCMKTRKICFDLSEMPKDMEYLTKECHVVELQHANSSI